MSTDINDLINELKLNNIEQKKTINNLQVKVEEQNKIINNLQVKVLEQSILNNEHHNKINKLILEVEDQHIYNKISFIIIILSVIILNNIFGIK